MTGHAPLHRASRHAKAALIAGQTPPRHIVKSVRKQAGATLMEVLVTFVILSIGILGLAGLQTRALVYSQSALYRSQATALADDIVDRIRANRGGSYATTLTTAETATTPVDKNDLREWKAQITQLLPAGQGAVVVDGTDSTLFTITISWTDDRSSATESNTSLTTKVRL